MPVFPWIRDDGFGCLSGVLCVGIGSFGYVGRLEISAAKVDSCQACSE